MLISVLSLLPASYSAGYSSGNALSGTAGANGTPETPTGQPSAFNTYITVGSRFVGIFSGLIISFSSIRSVQIENRAQKLMLERIRIDDEMQKREIEKLRLELEAEKLKTKRQKKTNTRK